MLMAIAVAPSVLFVSVSCALSWYAYRSRRLGFTVAATVAALFALFASSVGVVAALSIAFGDVAAVEPSQKAVVLSESISAAMNGGAVGGALSLFAALVSLAVGVAVYSGRVSAESKGDADAAAAESARGGPEWRPPGG